MPAVVMGLSSIVCRVDSKLLKSGDRIQVGRTLMIFTGGPEPASTRSLEEIEIVALGDDDEPSRDSQ